MERFFFMGDIGSFSTELYNIVNKIKSKKLQSNICYSLLGDNFYPYGVKSSDGPEWDKFKQIFENIPSINIYAVLGNHDYYYLESPIAQKNSLNWTMDNYYFMKQHGNIGIWYIDTQILDPGNPHDTNFFMNLYSRINAIHGNTFDIFNKQIEWLKKSLEENKKIKYKIVVGHYPIISCGAYSKNNILYEFLIPIFKKFNIQIYISGHDHNNQHINFKPTICSALSSYKLNQFIVGCADSKGAYGVINNKASSEGQLMFFSTAACILKLQIINNYLSIKYKNENYKTIYKYKIK